MDAYKVIIEPLLTEKSNLLREGEQKKYVFKVDKRVNKTQVMKAVEVLFSVRPVSCNILNVRGKKKMNRPPVMSKGFRRGFGQTPSWKKAVVTLPVGKKIDVFEGV